MTAPNELIKRLSAIANTEANELADALNEAADLLQSQAERIAELEADRENTIAIGKIALDEATALRAQLAQDVEASMINLPEPVAWFANYGGNVYTEAQLKQAVRDALDAQGVEDAARYRWLRDYLISPSTHFDDLIVSADKAETLDGVIDAARAKGAKQ